MKLYLKYLSIHFREDVTLEQVSAAIGYSQSEISHTLSGALSMNFRAIVKSLRIDYAKNILCTKNYSIKQVSWECGYTCERSFHRAFKSITGITPMEFKLSQHPNKFTGTRTSQANTVKEAPAIKRIKV